MKVRVIDFETYYDRAYSLSKLTTEEYVRDARFETIGFAYQDFTEDGTPLALPVWVSGPDSTIRAALHGLGWDDVHAVAHNMRFDGAILLWRYGIRPARYACTVDLSQPLFGFTTGCSLRSVAQALGIGEKGYEVESAMGKRRVDFTPEELARYGRYCQNDVELTGKIFFALHPQTPPLEQQVIDLMIRMFVDPVLVLDVPLLKATLEEVRTNRVTLVKGALRVAAARSPVVAEHIRTLHAGGDSLGKVFSSNKLFAEVLRALGYPVPQKTSPTTGKPIPALGKKDPEFLEMEEAYANDPTFAAIVAARKQTKSTLIESRIQRLIGIGERGPMLAPLRYYAAHTGRAGGTDSLNLQNLPRGSALRKAIMAPDGHTLVVADSSQIEARGVAWVARQQDVLDLFASGADVYKHMAGKIYDKPIEAVTKDERQVGKLCVLGLGYGMGHRKYKDLIRQVLGKDIPGDEAKRIVSVYRAANAKVKDFWTRCDEALRVVTSGGAVQLGPTGRCPLYFYPATATEPARIELPRGLYLRYHGLRRDTALDAWVYDSRNKTKYLHGGVVTENIVQALARLVVFEQMVAIDHLLRKAAAKYGGIWRVVLTVHDEVVACAPEDHAERVLERMVKIMQTPPDWAYGWPINAEGSIANRYGDAK